MAGEDIHREKVQDRQPGSEEAMAAKPVFIREGYRGSDKLKEKTAIITGGDSGIGRAVAVHFAREGADVVIAYFVEDDDANETKHLVEAEGSRCHLSKGDVGSAAYCAELIEEVHSRFGKLDILVNNAAEQHPTEDITEISDEQLQRTFRTNVFGYYNMIRAALPFMKNGARIINTSSVVAHRGSHHLMDYAGTKGAIEALTKSIAKAVADRGINVNCVAPGPIWTPLIPATFDKEKIEKFGKNTLIGRAGQPCEVAPCFVFLAAQDASYITGETLHPDGGSLL